MRLAVLSFRKCRNLITAATFLCNWVSHTAHEAIFKASEVLERRKQFNNIAWIQILKMLTPILPDRSLREVHWVLANRARDRLMYVLFGKAPIIR